MMKYKFGLMEGFPESRLLPDPFAGPDGKRISKPEQWPAQREYLLNMLDYFLYGPMPPEPDEVTGMVTKTERRYGGAAVLETVRLDCGQFQFDISVLRPNKPGRFPAICACILPPSIAPLPTQWETVCERDYVLASVNAHDIALDKAEGGGPLYDAYRSWQGKAIMAWSWAVMRMNDYLVTCGYVDDGKLIAAGFSRLGKQALCTAIHDTRIALAGLFESGCGGCGAFRILGTARGPLQDGSASIETLSRMMRAFPHWFSDNMRSFINLQEPYPVKYEYCLPFDMHFARALLAPRFAIATNALGDDWANLYGDYGTWLASREVYRFLGAEENTAFFYREGHHAYDRSDWLAMLDFADLKFRGISREGIAQFNQPLYSGAQYFDWEMPR